MVNADKMWLCAHAYNVIWLVVCTIGLMGFEVVFDLVDETVDSVGNFGW